MKLNSLFILSALIALLTSALSARAQSPTTRDIIDALEPKPLTRTWSRGVTVEEGAPSGPPSIDLHVTFAYDSDVLDTDASLTLDNLALALSDRRLSAYRFIIAGHTDAKGSEDYNLSLSDRRAQSVLRYLTQNHKITVGRLEATGLGESQLLDPTRPEDGINRRVQIVNISAVGPTAIE